jgi:hypothetical protein
MQFIRPLGHNKKSWYSGLKPYGIRPLYYYTLMLTRALIEFIKNRIYTHMAY